MTINQPTTPTTLAACLAILVAAGCPEPPEWCDYAYGRIIGAGYSQSDGDAYFTDDAEVNSPPAVTAALESWVMGVVVPWMNREWHRVMFYHCTLGWTFRIGRQLESDRYIKDYSAAVLALAVVICGVVGEVKA